MSHTDYTVPTQANATVTNYWTPTSVAVTFNELVNTVVNETVFIVGNITQLGNGNASLAFPLGASNYTNTYPLWNGTVGIPQGTRFVYTVIVRGPAGNFTYNPADSPSKYP